MKRKGKKLTSCAKRRKNWMRLAHLEENSSSNIENVSILKNINLSSNAHNDSEHMINLFDTLNRSKNSSEIDLFGNNEPLNPAEKKSPERSKVEEEVLSETLCRNLNSEFFTPKPSTAKKKRLIVPEVQVTDDSIFGDVDLSLIEHQCKTLPEANEDNNYFNTLTSTPSIKGRLSTPFNIENKSESSKSAGPLRQKLLQRLQANAKIATPRQIKAHPSALRSPIAESGKSQRKSQIVVDYFNCNLANISTQDIGPFYGLPSTVRDLIKEVKGIKSIYEWQNDCLTLNSVQSGKNLIYSLPTSGGKTLVAEILIMKTLLCKKKNAILILPFVAIVQEKVRGFAQFADKLDFLVEEYAGSKGKFPPTQRRKRNSVFVCTIEKANTLVNSLIEVGRLDSIGLVVVDELHMIGEGGRRGATIEMTLSKILFIEKSLQIIGMSATLKNIDEIGKFLNAEIYTNNFRPVQLHEHVKIEESIYKIEETISENNMQFDRVINHKNKSLSMRDPDHIVSLLLEVIPDHSSLVFCATKKNCENLAIMICKLLPKSFQENKKQEKIDLLNLLFKESGDAGLCNVLRQTIPWGIAYHHSGLTSDERYLIENAYSTGVLCVLTCTSTLAAGVNLPARRVIIRSPYVGRKFLSRVQYKQMIGRAGRKGIDTIGESFLILTNQRDKEKVSNLVVGSMETCVSSLMYDSGKGFKTLLLSLIGLKLMKKIEDVETFFNGTLFAHQMQIHEEQFINNIEKENFTIKLLAEKYLQELMDLNLIRMRQHCENNSKEILIEATVLGNSTLKGSIDLEITNQVYQDLKKGLQSLVLSNYLHLLYLVTPHDSVENIMPNWMTYLELYSRLDEGEVKAATVIGITEQYLAAKASGHNLRKKKMDEFVVKRFYVTLMLNMLFNGLNVWQVSNVFNQPRGFLQNLLASSSSFASNLLHFTQELDAFWPYHALLEKLSRSLQFCTSAEIVPLMEIPGVKLGRAKQLYNAGFKTFSHIANTTAKTLMDKIEHLPRKQALQIISSSKVMLKEKIEELQAQAEELQTVPVIAP